MTDQTTLPLLTESKLYELARSTQLLNFLIPAINVQMTVELQLEEEFKREADDGDDTRILINYTNYAGRSILYKFPDHERLERRFGVDSFLNGFMGSIQKEPGELDVSIGAINATLQMALTIAVTTLLGLNTQDGMTKNTEEVSKVILQSLTAILFNDALDVIVAVQEKPLAEGQTIPELTIAAMWIAKQRPIVAAATSDRIH